MDPAEQARTNHGQCGIDEEDQRDGGGIHACDGSEVEQWSDNGGDAGDHDRSAMATERVASAAVKKEQREDAEQTGAYG